MLGLFKLICPTRFVRVLQGMIWGSSSARGCPRFWVATVVLCFAGLSLSTAKAQRAVYPYPAAPRTAQNAPATRGLSNGFSQQAAFQFPGQTQNFTAPSVVSPNIVPQNTPQGFGNQLGLTPQNPAFQGQPALGQPQFVQPQAPPAQGNFNAQSNFLAEPGIPQGSVQADIDVFLPQGPSGKLVAGGTFGSDNGLVGEIIVDERDFNIFAFPRSFSDLTNPRVFRGAGQSFRAEIVPGTDLERYLVSFGDPYFLNSDYSVNLSGFFFDRQFFDYDEQRAGGKIRVGKPLTSFLSLKGGLSLENVTIDNARVNTSTQLNDALGNSNLFSFDVGLVYDTRQSPFLLDSGSYLSLTYRQAFGDFDFGRGEIEYRTQRLITKRTATTGHSTLSYRTKLGFSGSSTPVFENFFAGGVTTLRGFDFRGVSPVEGNVRVGGEFQWLNSLEYQFPITNDDMIRGVAFVDFGTVEDGIEINSDNFRVAPGVGLRIDVPFAGISAPFSIDFAFPTDEAFGDDKRTISFLVRRRAMTPVGCSTPARPSRVSHQRRLWHSCPTFTRFLNALGQVVGFARIPATQNQGILANPTTSNFRPRSNCRPRPIPFSIDFAFPTDEAFGNDKRTISFLFGVVQDDPRRLGHSCPTLCGFLTHSGKSAQATFLAA